MYRHRYRRNNSQVDLTKLISESQRKANYLNKILDNDVYFHMMTESNSPLKDKERFFRNDYNINNKNYLDSKSQMLRLNNVNNLNTSRIYRKEKQNFQKDRNNNYINDNLDYSLNINKPFHREKKHFPLINNNGNFFKKENSFLLLNKRKIANIFSNNQRKYYKNRLYSDYNKFNNFDRQEFKSFKNVRNINRSMNLGRSNSMLNMQNHLSKINIKDKFIHNIKKNSYNDIKDRYEDDESNNSKNEKHYSPRRFDYEASRFGDVTYNFLLNEPMRGDVSSDWKFPPLYYYDRKIDYGKCFPDY